jgi:hypothetical protein
MKRGKQGDAAGKSSVYSKTKTTKKEPMTTGESVVSFFLNRRGGMMVVAAAAPFPTNTNMHILQPIFHILCFPNLCSALFISERPKKLPAIAMIPRRFIILGRPAMER